MPEALYQPFPMLSGRRAQLWRHHPQYRRPRHFHAEPELNLVLRGAAVLSVGNQTIPAARGDLLCFAPGQDHALLEASEDLELLVMAVQPELMQRAVPLGTRTQEGAMHLDETQLERLESSLSGLDTVSEASVVETTLADFFALVRRTLPIKHVVSTRALACIADNPSWSNNALARHLNTAPGVLSRKFHQDFGVPFVSYRARQRLMQFIEHVDRGDGLLRAALRAEFGSYAQCYRVFERTLGCSPQAYFQGARHLIDSACL